MKNITKPRLLVFAFASVFAVQTAAAMTRGGAADVKVVNDAWIRGGDGEVVCRQGGGIFRFGDAWYRYGVDYPVAHEFASNSVRIAKSNYDGSRVIAFVSRDFAQWEAKGSVVADGEIPPGWIGRMGVAKVGATYAIVIQTALGVSVYTAATPLGPFRHSHELDFTGITGFKGTGDQTVFADEDTGKYYLVFSKPKGRDRTYVAELGLDAEGRVGIVRWQEVFGGFNREANCMFKRGGRYYLCASNIYGWDASLTYWLVGDTPFGPFKREKGADMNVMAGCERDYSHVSQVGFFYTLRSADGRELVLYYGDRWTQWADNGKGFEVCEPISFDESDAPRFHSLSSWWLDPKAATWRVADDNNWCLNGSFDADRRLLPLANKPRQEHITGWRVEVIEGNRIALDNPASPHLNASNSVPDHAFVSGKFALVIDDTVPFRRRVTQKIEGLPDGDYNLSYMIDEGNGWQRRTETHAATNGECEIVFDRTTPCRIDDVKVIKDTPKEISFGAYGSETVISSLTSPASTPGTRRFSIAASSSASKTPCIRKAQYR